MSAMASLGIAKRYSGLLLVMRAVKTAWQSNIFMSNCGPTSIVLQDTKVPNIVNQANVIASYGVLES
jgi:hypothetical protein